jgi:hypothetical protein
MKHSIDEAMDEARRFFLEHGATATSEEGRRMSECLREMAEAVQENARMLDVLRRELDEVHHVLGVR